MQTPTHCKHTPASPLLTAQTQRTGASASDESGVHSQRFHASPVGQVLASVQLEEAIAVDAVRERREPDLRCANLPGQSSSDPIPDSYTDHFCICESSSVDCRVFSFPLLPPLEQHSVLASLMRFVSLSINRFYVFPLL